MSSILDYLSNTIETYAVSTDGHQRAVFTTYSNGFAAVRYEEADRQGNWGSFVMPTTYKSLKSAVRGAAHYAAKSGRTLIPLHD